MAPKILFYDLETMANKAFVWGKYEQDVIAYIQEGYILSWSAKWLGGKQITRGLYDYSGYKPNVPDDKKLISELHDLISQADIIVAHNGDRFDIRKMNTRFVFHKLSPPAPYKSVDTLKVAKKHFAFNSNKLDDLGNFLGVGRKVKHPGFDLWLGCETGNPAAWKLMKRYNKQDVLLLEAVYKKLLPWISNHPNQGFYREGTACPKCGSVKLQSRGTQVALGGKFQRYQCQDCGGWARSKKNESSTKPLINA